MGYTSQPPDGWNEEYINNGYCPQCGCSDTEAIEDAMDHHGERGEVMECLGCHNKWLEVHKTVGILLWEDDPPTPPTPVYCSDDVQQLALVTIANRLEERHMQQALISEADFLMGAASAMGVASGSEAEKNQVWGPATAWIFYIMGNRSVLAERMRKAGKQVQGDKVEAEQEEFTRWYRHMDEMVKFIKHVHEQTVHLEMGHRQVESLRYKATDLLDTLGELDRMMEDRADGN